MTEELGALLASRRHFSRCLSFHFILFGFLMLIFITLAKTRHFYLFIPNLLLRQPQFLVQEATFLLLSYISYTAHGQQYLRYIVAGHTTISAT